MSTRQKYGQTTPKARTPELTAPIEAILRPITLPESRPVPDRDISLEYIYVNKSVLGEYQKIISAVSDFLGDTSSPIGGLTYLLKNHLISQGTSPSSHDNRKVESILGLIDFVDELRVGMTELEFIERIERETIIRYNTERAARNLTIS